MSLLQRWWFLLLLCPLVAGVGGAAIAQRLPSIYEATETLAVQPVTGPDGVPDVQAAQALADTYAEQIRAKPVLTAAARSVGLGDLSESELTNLVQARRLTNTALVRVTVQNGDAAVAAQLASAIVQAFVAQNAEGQTARYAATLNNLASLVTQYQSSRDALNHEIDSLRAEPVSTPRDAQISKLQDRTVQLQASESIAARALQDVQLAMARGSNELTVVDPAVAPTAPIRPNRLLSVAMAILAGLFAGVGIAWLAEQVDDRLRDPRGVMASLQLPTLARVPQTRSGVNACKPMDKRAQASFFELRSNILAALANHRARTIAIASAHDGDGKSAVAANLAMAIGHTGRKVILVDADLARPAQAAMFDVRDDPGLSGVLTGHVDDPTEVLQPTCEGGVEVLTAGTASFEGADPSGLLLSKRVPLVLEELQSRCDVLIIDTPALLARPEGAWLAARTDAVVLVLDARHARRRTIEPAVAVIREVGAPVIGVVLNRVPSGSVRGPSLVETPLYQPGRDLVDGAAVGGQRPDDFGMRRGVVRPARDD
jgi:capsular exopolysaccharide synthesis family protein